MHRTRRHRLGFITAALVFGLGCSREGESARFEGSTGGESAEGAAVPHAEQRMTLDEMDRVLRSISPQIEREGNAWALEYLDTPLLVITDPVANRMRIVTPVIEADQVTEDQWAAILVANFHTALDARYAVSGAVVYSLFLHPLGSLTEPDLRSAISQVVVLKRTFGTSYNSTGVVFGSGGSSNAAPATPPSL
ncbi:MAG: hypothetical protein AAF997_12530 [Myxococcota bacterium]